MEKTILKSQLGRFFSEFYEVAKERAIEANLCPHSNKIQIYYKDKGTLEYINIINDTIAVENLIKSLGV